MTVGYLNELHEKVLESVSNPEASCRLRAALQFLALNRLSALASRCRAHACVPGSPFWFAMLVQLMKKAERGVLRQEVCSSLKVSTTPRSRQRTCLLA